MLERPEPSMFYGVERARDPFGGGDITVDKRISREEEQEVRVVTFIRDREFIVYGECFCE